MIAQMVDDGEMWPDFDLVTSFPDNWSITVGECLGPLIRVFTSVATAL